MTVRATFTSDELLVYPSLGLTPVKGETYDVLELPTDGRWQLEGSGAESAAAGGTAPPQATTPAESAGPASSSSAPTSVTTNSPVTVTITPEV